MDITEKLFSLQDMKYKSFQAKLVPTVNSDSIIEVRTPQLRKLAKEIYGTAEAEAFLKVLPHKYYDENNLHAFLLELIGDLRECISRIDEFLPYIDNWATCDLMSPKCFKKHRPQLIKDIEKWLDTDSVYSVRFGVKTLIFHFLDDDFQPYHLELVSSVKSDEYYVNMAIAWYFQAALAKQYDFAVKLFEENRLSTRVHNKALQKAIESYAVSNNRKEYLKTLKR